MYENQGDDAAGHSCRVCGRAFSMISALNSHMRDDHGHGQLMINPTDVVDDDTSKSNSPKVKDKSLKRVAVDHDDDDNSPAKKTLTTSASLIINSPQSSDVNVVSYKVSQQTGQHRCDLCDKVFPTGQALGGHRSACRHRRQDNSVVLPQPPSSANLYMQQHQCDLCDRVVSTAQALGNHRASCIRKHQQAQSSVIQDNSVLPQPSRAPPCVLPLSSANSSVQGQATCGSSQSEAKVETRVDLNKTPPRRDDEDDASSLP